MNDEALELIISKARMLRELRRAKFRVWQLERQLRGESVEAEEEPGIPGFLARANPASAQEVSSTRGVESSTPAYLEEPSAARTFLTRVLRTTLHHCQHTTSLRLREKFRRTAGGHMEADGNTVVCDGCGDSWHFGDRTQLPEWLRQELIDRGL